MLNYQFISFHFNLIAANSYFLHCCVSISYYYYYYYYFYMYQYFQKNFITVDYYFKFFINILTAKFLLLAFMLTSNYLFTYIISEKSIQYPLMIKRGENYIIFKANGWPFTNNHQRKFCFGVLDCMETIHSQVFNINFYFNLIKSYFRLFH